jgi:hypothetical protein
MLCISCLIGEWLSDIPYATYPLSVFSYVKLVSNQSKSIVWDIERYDSCNLAIEFLCDLKGSKQYLTWVKSGQKLSDDGVTICLAMRKLRF